MIATPPIGATVYYSQINYDGEALIACEVVAMMVGKITKDQAGTILWPAEGSLLTAGVFLRYAHDNLAPAVAEVIKAIDDRLIELEKIIAELRTARKAAEDFPVGEGAE